jgi:hypothetical protein
MAVDRRCCIAQGLARRNPALITEVLSRARPSSHRGGGAGSAPYEYAVKARVATRRGIGAVLQDAAHSAR